jgi:hypothetical protein
MDGRSTCAVNRTRFRCRLCPTRSTGGRKLGPACHMQRFDRPTTTVGPCRAPSPGFLVTESWDSVLGQGIRAPPASRDLTNANLTGANMLNANLSNADLTGANLINADLDYADLDNAIFSTGTVLYDGQTVKQHGFDAASLQTYLEASPISADSASNLTIVPEPASVLLLLIGLLTLARTRF